MEFLKNTKMIVKRVDKREKGHFTQVLNYLMDAEYCEKLGLDVLKSKAYHLLSVLLSFADDWIFIPAVIRRKTRLGLTAYQNAMKELVKAGYIKIEKILNEKGRFKETKYYVSEIPEFKQENEKLKRGVVHYIKTVAQTWIKSISHPCDKNPYMDNPSMGETYMDNQIPKEPLNSDNKGVVAVTNNTNLSNTNSNNTYIKNTSSKEDLSNSLLKAKIEIEVSNDKIDDVSYIENLDEEIKEEELEGFEDPEEIRKIILAEREEMKKKNLAPLKPEEVEKIMAIEKQRSQAVAQEESKKNIISEEESKRVRDLLEKVQHLDKNGILVDLEFPEKYIHQYTKIDGKKLSAAHVSLCVEKFKKIYPKSSPIGYFKHMLDNPESTSQQLAEAKEEFISKTQKQKLINFFQILTGKRDEAVASESMMPTHILYYFCSISDNSLKYSIDHIKNRIKDAVSVFGEEFTMKFIPKTLKEILV